MSRIKILLDLEEFDKKELSEKERKRYIVTLSILSKVARKYLYKNRISKITYNRIHSLWLTLPREEDRKYLISTKEFHKLFNIEPVNLIYIKNAIKKLLIEIQKDSQSKAQEKKI